MTLIILGLLILLQDLQSGAMTSPFSHSGIYLRIAGFILFLIGFLSSCIVQIGTGEVGVQVLFGSVQNTYTGQWPAFYQSTDRRAKTGY